MHDIEESTHGFRLESRRSKQLDRKGGIEILKNFQRDFTEDSMEKSVEFSGLVEIKPKSHLEEIYT